MLTLTIFLIICFIVYLKSNFKFAPKKDVFKQIQKALKKMTPKNQESIKNQLFILLEEYKSEKTTDFTEAICNLRDAERSIQGQINNLWEQKRVVEHNLKLSPDPQLGGKLLYQKHKLEECSVKLESTLSTIRKQRDDINTKLETFSAELAIKKAEISTLVLINPLNNNTSSIDREINKLIKEFENLEFYRNTHDEVSAKIENVESVKEDDYNETEWIEKYKASIQ